MRSAILGTKVGMTRIIGDQGVMEPVTIVKAGPCTVLQVKGEETDRYNALQLALGDVKPHRSTKPMIGHAAKAGTGPKRHLREIRLAQPGDHAVGDVLTVQQFTDGEVRYVDVEGVTKGAGFMGVVKRHGFGGQLASHGVERKHRSAGSIGGHANTGTSRGIKKGKKMPGRMGNARRTVSSLKLLKVDAENDLLIIRGSIPGPNGGLVLVRQAKKRG
jgi:large subunit ribosomal protein L3